MQIRPFNDIHLDFDLDKKQTLSKLWEPVALPNDKETTLILAGDIWHSLKFLEFKNFSWFAHVSKRFKYVIFVLGNHDLWGGNLTLDYPKIRKELLAQKLNNVYLLQNDVLDLDGVRFVGATLWTNFNNGNPIVMQSSMNDKEYHWIKIGSLYKKLKPHDIYDAHIKSKNFIFTHAKKDMSVNKVVVISHHAPSYQSIPPEYKNQAQYYNNFVYFSDLDEQIYDSQIDYWFHGHTHNPIQYKIGETTVVNNARGYNGLQETGYNPELIINL